MADRRDPDTHIKETFSRYLADKGKGEDNSGGNYRTEAERELQRFHDWCLGGLSDPANASPASDWSGIVPAETDGTPTREVRFADLDTTVFADYARYLGASGLANGTVLTYYSYVASWCGWAQTQGYLPRHYAREADAEDPLPDDDGRKPGDQQAWTPDQRDRLARHVNREAEIAIDEFAEVSVPADERGDLSSDAVREKAYARLEAIKRCRDRALALMLCYTGLRVSEFVNDPEDDREGRNGVRWEDVSLENSHVTVYRKKQQWDEASLPAPVIPALRRYRQVLKPPDDWRVFPTLDRPTLSSHVQDGLHEEGLDESEIRELREPKPDFVTAVDEGLDSPPAINTSGARRIMKRLCEAADIDVDNDRHDYLAPHGGRRGIGETMVRQYGFAAAARYIDDTERQVRKAYQHIEAAEQADKATNALAQTDSSVRSTVRSDEVDDTESDEPGG